MRDGQNLKDKDFFRKNTSQFSEGMNAQLTEKQQQHQVTSLKAAKHAFQSLKGLERISYSSSMMNNTVDKADLTEDALNHQTPIVNHSNEEKRQWSSNEQHKVTLPIVGSKNTDMQQTQPRHRNSNSPTNLQQFLQN